VDPKFIKIAERKRESYSLHLNYQSQDDGLLQMQERIQYTEALIRREPVLFIQFLLELFDIFFLDQDIARYYYHRPMGSLTVSRRQLKFLLLLMYIA
jgi:hypothetical protein